MRELYKRDKARAKQRGISWSLTYDQWRAIWGDKISSRGRRPDDHCMARNGPDVGAYAVGNVRIISNRQNWKESGQSKLSRVQVADRDGNVTWIWNP